MCRRESISLLFAESPVLAPTRIKEIKSRFPLRFFRELRFSTGHRLGIPDSKWRVM